MKIESSVSKGRVTRNLRVHRSIYKEYEDALQLQRIADESIANNLIADVAKLKTPLARFLSEGTQELFNDIVSHGNERRMGLIGGCGRLAFKGKSFSHQLKEVQALLKGNIVVLESKKRPRVLILKPELS